MMLETTSYFKHCMLFGLQKEINLKYDYIYNVKD